MSNKVLILMSTYNGSRNIIRQVESIFKQVEVEVSIYIRDDGSDIETISVLKKLEEIHKGRLNIEFGENIGWKRSFLELVYNSDLDYDYYGFSDQDDIWMEDKLQSCIHLMELDTKEGLKLAHCNSLSVDEYLQLREEQEKRIPCPPSYKSAIATEYFQGCGMVWNLNAMKLIKQYKPQNMNLAHDYWVGLICYMFGNIYFCEAAKFYHVRYGNNSSEDGNVFKGRMNRLKGILRKDNIYMNPAEDLCIGYMQLLENDVQLFLTRVSTYKHNKKNKMQTLLDKDFRRPTKYATLLFKISILLNLY
jgi:glycosyltransferase involved in cell wall biosynthesis